MSRLQKDHTFSAARGYKQGHSDSQYWKWKIEMTVTGFQRHPCCNSASAGIPLAESIVFGIPSPKQVSLINSFGGKEQL
jgi:hypothetical protein